MCICKVVQKLWHAVEINSWPKLRGLNTSRCPLTDSLLLPALKVNLNCRISLVGSLNESSEQSKKYTFTIRRLN